VLFQGYEQIARGYDEIVKNIIEKVNEDLRRASHN